jgi:hypothetical protein
MPEREIPDWVPPVGPWTPGPDIGDDSEDDEEDKDPDEDLPDNWVPPPPPRRIPGDERRIYFSSGWVV